MHERALRAGAVEVTKLSDDPFGERESRIRDPFGNIWWIQTHVEDIDDEEIMRRMAWENRSTSSSWLMQRRPLTVHEGGLVHNMNPVAMIDSGLTRGLT